MLNQLTNNVHWNYLLALDTDVAHVARYIEFAPPNYETYSLELAGVLMAAASEVDVVAKIACSYVNPNAKPENIDEYRDVLVPNWPNLPNYPVQLSRFGLNCTPWANWANKANPDWWRAYNNVKHKRNKHYGEANLKHAIDAVAGLYVMLLYAFPREAEGALGPPPTLFSIPMSHIEGTMTLPSGETLIKYRL